MQPKRKSISINLWKLFTKRKKGGGGVKMENRMIKRYLIGIPEEKLERITFKNMRKECFF